jgi:hypothetical protein
MTRLELMNLRGLQSPDNISKYINQLKHLYSKKSSNIVFQLINEWETKLEDKLNELNLIK